MKDSKISWTDHTFNPWIGCTKVATGCANCYAEADFDKRRHKAQWGPHGTRLLTSKAYWRQPLKWDREAERDGVRRRVFCGSLCDVFESFDGWILDARGDVVERSKLVTVTLDDLRSDLFRLIDQTPNLDWLLLTKRPENARTMAAMAAQKLAGENWPSLFPWPNVWLGCSASTQEDLDAAVPHLLSCRNLAPVLFLSLEPLTGPIDLDAIADEHGRIVGCCDNPSCEWCVGTGLAKQLEVDWVIVGGESGTNARPCEVQWIRDVVRQCHGSGVPCFVKQLGGNISDADADYCSAESGRTMHDPKGGNPDEWPAALRVQQFPR